MVELTEKISYEKIGSLLQVIEFWKVELSRVELKAVDCSYFITRRIYHMRHMRDIIRRLDESVEKLKRQTLLTEYIN